MAEGFDSDFAKGEAEAKRLVSRMEQALKRAEEFERQAEREAQIARRQGSRPSDEGGDAQSSERVQRRLSDERAISDQARERERLVQRETSALQAQERIVRGGRAAGPYAYTDSVMYGSGGGIPPSRQLPPGPPGGYGGQGSGGYYQYPGQRQLPP